MEYAKLFQDAVESIEQHLLERVDIGELAARTYFSKYYFQRLFHVIVGDSIMEYIKKRRLTLAAQELAETNATVLEIALKYGYGSHEGFTRAFKAYHGITPQKSRKYGVTRHYGKAWINKEEWALNQNGTDRDGMLSESAVMQLSENTRQLMQVIAGFVQEARRIAEETSLRVESRKPYYDSFASMAREMSHLAERVDWINKRLQRFTDTEQGAFKVDGFIQAYSGAWEIIKNIEDLAFQMNILTLSYGIEYQRLTVENQSGIKDLLDAMMALTRSIVGDESGRTTGIIRDMIGYVSLDILKESLTHLDETVTIIRGMRERTDAAYRVVDNGAKQHGVRGGAMGVVAREVFHLCGRVAHLADDVERRRRETERVSTVKDFRNTLSDIHGVIRAMEDSAFQVNILAFGAEVEAARAGGQCKEFNDAEATLMRLAGFLQEQSNAAMPHISEITRLLSLFDIGREENADDIRVKYLSDITFQFNLLGFYLTMEAARLYACLPDKSADFARYSDELRHTTGELHGVVQKLADGGRYTNDASAYKEARACGEKLAELSRKIEEAAKDAGAQGGPFGLLAMETGGLAGVLIKHCG